MCGKSVVCPFSFKRVDSEFCDNFVSGVPVCVVDGFYLQGGYEEQVEEFERECAGLPPEKKVLDCSRFCRSRFYEYAMSKDSRFKCFFGGLCVRVSGGCSVCSRWRSV